MGFSEKYIKAARWFLPMPFTIAILLTALAFLGSMLVYQSHDASLSTSLYDLFNFWEVGLWNTKLLAFAVQMMLMLVLGHVLACSNAANYLINKILVYCTSTARAAFIVSFTTIIVSWLNWGLGLIFGAILARKVGEYAKKNSISINYPIIGACGYVGLMIWHGGLSGSAPLKIAEKGHFFEDIMGVIYLNKTIFSNMNLFCSLIILTVIPFSVYMISKKAASTKLPDENIDNNTISNEIHFGAERIDHSIYFGKLVGFLLLVYLIIRIVKYPDFFSLGFLNPNFINLFLLGLGLSLHKSLASYVNNIELAITGAAGILLQFPLYFGIMGLISSSGLLSNLSGFFVEISNQHTFPIFTLISAGIVNIFVPSGGGQWAVQGPIIIEAANSLNVSLSKAIMAMAYGDQLTNMLQPFWALPLLGITGLKAKDILPYTLFFMLIGIFIFSMVLIIF